MTATTAPRRAAAAQPASKPPAPKPPAPTASEAQASALNTLAVALLFVPAILAFGPVFGGTEGYVAAGGGVLVGLALGWVSRHFRWALATTLAATVGSYLLFGGVFALRKTTIAGFVPTLDTLVRLVPLTVQAWRDLLTVSLPAGNFVGPAVVPYLSGLVLALVATRLAIMTRAYLWALLPPLAMLLIGILWGLDVAPLGAFWGVGYGVVALLWAAWRRIEGGRAEGEEILFSAGSRGLARRRLRGAVAMIAGAAALALAVSPLLATGERQVLRQTVRPPLNLQDYASPLTSYRYFELDQREVGLFTVSGMPAGGRIRLASLDAYDGRVYSVEDASAGFIRIGEQSLGSAQGTPATLSVTIQAYTGVWLPGGGTVRGVTFHGPNAEAQTESLYYNPYGGTLLTTAGVADGDGYSVSVVTTPQPDLPANAVPAPVSEPELQGVPDVIGQTAADWAAEAKTPVEQLQVIEKRLQEGFYSDGSDGLSRAGHSAARIAAMLGARQLIGDDEQYAVAMALMARQLGIPSRVVMGFYPEAGTPASDSLQVTGTMAHAWVEVPFEGLGWVQFDPTPDRDRRPQTTVPKPKPTPKPQVLPPPDPPLNRPDAAQDDPGDKRDNEDDQGNDLLLRIMLGVGIGLGVGALVAAPFVTIGLLKRRRRERRLNDPLAANRISGAWSELTDAATDLGTKLPGAATRRETAALLVTAYPETQAERIAADVDAGVFGAAEPTVEAATAVWADVDRSVGSMKDHVGRWRRILGFCSLRSFRRPPKPTAGAGSPPKQGDAAPDAQVAGTASETAAAPKARRLFRRGSR